MRSLAWCMRFCPTGHSISCRRVTLRGASFGSSTFFDLSWFVKGLTRWLCICRGPPLVQALPVHLPLRLPRRLLQPWAPWPGRCGPAPPPPRGAGRRGLMPRPHHHLDARGLRVLAVSQ